MTQHKSRRIRASSFTKLFQLSKVQSLWRRLSLFSKPRARRSDPHLEIDMANATSHSRVSTRTLAMALMAVAIAASLAACGGGGGVSSTPEQAPATLPTTPVAPVAPVVTPTCGKAEVLTSGTCVYRGYAVTYGEVAGANRIALLTADGAVIFDGAFPVTVNACAIDTVRVGTGVRINCFTFTGGGATYVVSTAGQMTVQDTALHADPEYKASIPQPSWGHCGPNGRGLAIPNGGGCLEAPLGQTTPYLVSELTAPNGKVMKFNQVDSVWKF